MAQREEAKEQNREKIKDAAAQIIREEGMERLTMRHLADVAAVSLRTPYNLFGSKTDVLVALLEEATWGIVEAIGTSKSQLVLEGLLSGVDHMEAFFAKDEDFYRDVYWGIMSSDQVETRFESYQRMIDLVQSAVGEAFASKELVMETDRNAFGRHIAIQLMALLGMWGSGYFDSAECAGHIKAAWCASFLTKASRKSKPHLMTAMKQYGFTDTE